MNFGIKVFVNLCHTRGSNDGSIVYYIISCYFGRLVCRMFDTVFLGPPEERTAKLAVIITFSMMCKLWKYVSRKCVLYLRAGYLAHFNWTEGCSHEWSARGRFVISCIPWIAMNGDSSWNFCVWYVQNPAQIFMERLRVVLGRCFSNKDFNFLWWCLKNVSGESPSSSELTKMSLCLLFLVIRWAKARHNGTGTWTAQLTFLTRFGWPFRLNSNFALTVRPLSFVFVLQIIVLDQIPFFSYFVYLKGSKVLLWRAMSVFLISTFLDFDIGHCVVASFFHPTVLYYLDITAMGVTWGIFLYDLFYVANASFTSAVRGAAGWCG